MSQLIPPPTSYSPFQYHPGTGTLILVACNGTPSYNFDNLATYSFDGTSFTLLSGFPSQSTTNSGPPLMTNTSMAYDGTNMVLFSGKGVTPSNYLNSTWLLNSSGVWAKSAAPNTSIATAPQQRASAYMAQQDAASTLMFGGVDNQLTFTDAGSVYNYSEAGGWVNVPVAFLPPCRLNGSVASNGTSQVLCGFGANRNGGCLNDLYSWSGAAWSKLTTTGANTTSGAPSARHSAAMCWNGASYVLFSGQDQGGNPLQDTWTLNTTGAFTQVTTTNQPSARWGAQMAYLSSASAVFLFGGVNGSAYPLADCWKLPVGGTTWVQVF